MCLAPEICEQIHSCWAHRGFSKRLCELLENCTCQSKPLKEMGFQLCFGQGGVVGEEVRTKLNGFRDGRRQDFQRLTSGVQPQKLQKRFEYFSQSLALCG